MNWKLLNDYRCPKCSGHLRLIKANEVFVCDEDSFAISQKRRAQLAKEFPVYIDLKIEAHFKDIVIA